MSDVTTTNIDALQEDRIEQAYQATWGAASGREETMTWQRTYPTEPGYYWFWTGIRAPDEPGHQPEIVAVDGDTWHHIGEGTRFDVRDFPGYCAGPLLPPARNGWTIQVAEERK